MRLRLTKIDEYQFLTCVKHSLWGSRFARFKDWQKGDYLAIIVDKAIAGLAEVTGDPFQSKEHIWDNGIFPHRVPINFTHILTRNQRPPILGEIRDVMIKEWGQKYGFGILNQIVLEGEKSEIIVNAIRSRPNSLAEVISNIEQLLQEAHQERELLSRREVKKQPQPKIIAQQLEEGTKTEKEVSLHSKAQSMLIKLGKISRCSVWIATNDRTREFKGKPLGDGCLKLLPNLGLGEEATRQISFIDIIWIKQNVPLYAFEVEAKTSIYSGLLRMSDLLSLMPSLIIKLFVVAPRERQERVMTELARPTFRKIGLSDYCRFIPIEDIEKLLARVEGLEGHIEPTILDAIAVGFETQV